MPRASSVDIELYGEEVSPEKIEVNPDRPYRIAILGDFSGRQNRTMRPVRVDRDNVDDVMAVMRPEVRLPHMQLDFSSIDDFHPDHIFGTAAVFQELEEKRHAPPPRPAQAAAAQPAPPPSSFSLDDVFEETMARSEGRKPADPFADFLRDIMAPHLEAKPDTGRREWEMQVERVMTEQMRSILHEPRFQALEAAWRAVEFLVRRLDTDEDVHLYLMDVPKSELTFAHLGNLFDSPAGEPWTLLAGNYIFDESSDDLKLLARIAAAARASGAPFLASMKDPPLGPGWMQLRQMTEARWLGMAFPRFLLRLPYGERSSAIESFPFEEMEEPPRHEDYLWGNAALACVCLAGQGFRASLDGLPVHVYHEEGESKMKPCAELLLTQSQVEAMLEMGLMPLISFRDRDVVRLPRFQSIADPLAPLAFRS